MKYIYYLFIIGSFSIISCNTANEGYGVAPYETTEAGLNWYKMEDLEHMKHIENKKILVDVYTSWCGWCKKMDSHTFTDPAVVDYLNKHYVLVKFDAEQRQPLIYQGEEYALVKAGRRQTNRLAVKLLDGRIGYPTIVYLEGSTLEKLKSSPGYKDAQKLLTELQSLMPSPTNAS